MNKQRAIDIVMSEPELPITKWSDYGLVFLVWLISLIAPTYAHRATVKATKLSIVKRLEQEL